MNHNDKMPCTKFVLVPHECLFKKFLILVGKTSDVIVTTPGHGLG